MTTRQLIPSALALTLALWLGGCAATQEIQQGDTAALTRNHAAAAEHYQRALIYDPKLGQDPAFVAKLNYERSRAAYDLGRTLAASEVWDRAIEKFTEAVTIDPTFVEAAQARTAASKNGSQALLRKALAEADQGRLPDATGHARQAVQLDDANQAAHEALASTTTSLTAPPPIGKLPEAQPRFAAALALRDQKRWPEAIDGFRAVLAVTPYHLPARAELFRAQQNLAQAQKLANDGAAALGQKRLDQAVAAFQQSLDLWPNQDQVRALLAQATTQRDQTLRLLSDARQMAQGGRFDEALAAVTSAQAVWPTYGPATEAQRQIRQTAADTHAATGQRLLREQHLDEAEAAFVHALQYVPNSSAAVDGLGQAALARGQAAEEKGLPGAALLWYQEAAARNPKADVASRLARAQAAVAEHIAFALAFTTGDTGGRPTADSAALERIMLGLADGARPRFVALVPPNDPQHPAAFLASAAVTFQTTTQSDRPNHFLKTGKLTLRVDTKDTATGGVVDSAAFEKNSANQSPEGVRVPVGAAVPPQALGLPTDEDVRTALMTKAAADAVGRALGAALAARSAQFLTVARQHEAKQEFALAIEAGVAAALLLEPAQPNETARLMQSMRQRFAPVGAAPAGRK